MWDNINLPQGNIFKNLLEKNIIPLVSAVFLKKAFNDVGGIPKFYQVCEDYYLFLGISEKWEALALNDVCCTYRCHERNLSHQYQDRTYLENKLISLKWNPSYSIYIFFYEILYFFLKKLLTQLFPLEFFLGKRTGDRSILIWGAGEKGKKCLKYLKNRNINIDGFVDKSLEKQNFLILNKPVFSPEIVCAKKHMIVISSMYGSEIEDELIELGFRHKTDFVHDNLA